MVNGSTCGSCEAVNPASARFCMACGAPLERSCPSCGANAPAGAKFCIECGATLAADGPPPSADPAPAADEALPEERRPATILFADLSGYTAAASKMDPEVVKGVIDRILRRLAAEIERVGGTVDKFIGDNVMGVFGAPTAHEDDPERAVRAGLAMQAAMADLNEDASLTEGITFSLRVGINTGEVMAGAVGDRYTVMGDPVNVASRLEGAGRPGSVTVGRSTYSATRHRVDYVELEPLTLKGKDEPVPAWEAVSMSARGQTGARGVSRLVGRTNEADLLGSLAERSAREGKPILVTVVGQAGVGKTRLLREFGRDLEEGDDAPAIRTGRCPPYGAGIAYWALGEILRTEFGIAEREDPDDAWARLSDGVTKLMEEASDPGAAQRYAASLALALNMTPPRELLPSESADPQKMRESLFSAVRAVIEAISHRRPLVLAIEDIHWADEGMLDLIDHLARSVRGPLLLVCLTREELFERRPDWGGGKINATVVSLDPLDPGQTRDLVSELLPADVPGDRDALVAKIAERAGGNPFFAEEIVNRLADEGEVDPDALPSSVQSLLAARLDSLERGERRLLLHASVVGQTFAISEVEPAALAEELDSGIALATLEEKDLIARTGAERGSETEYSFKHALIRDAAYGMLPKSIRAAKHAEIGELIESRQGERADAVAGLVAEHFARAATLAAESGLDREQRAQLNEKAIASLEVAGDEASSLYSNPEALDRYRAALELCDTDQPGDWARIGEKCGDIALRMGRVDDAVEVWKRCVELRREQGDDVRVADLNRRIGAGLWHKGERKSSIDHYQRGIDLLKDGEPKLELVRLYEEAASLYMHTGDNMLAIYASEKALRLAERLGESGAASRAHGIFGRVFGRIGDAEKARENLERSVALSRDSDPAEAVRALLSLGYHLELSETDYEAAARCYSEAIEIAEGLGDVTSQVELHASLGHLAIHRAAWDEVAAAAEKSRSLSEREGLHGKLCFPAVLQGALAWRTGDWAGAERASRQAADLADEAGHSEVAFSGLYWLATALRDKGEPDAAEQELTRALDTCERAGLIVQRVEAAAARVATLALAGRHDDARRAQEETASLGAQLGYPVAEAACAEAAAMVADGDAEGDQAVERAREGWTRLGRPLDAARVLLTRGRILGAAGNDGAGDLLERAAAEFTDLDAPGPAARSRGTAPA